MANTKIIKIERELPVTNDTLYVRKDYMAEACRILTPSGFKLLFYLLARETNNFEFSRADCIEKMGVSARSVTSAFADLEEAGYLTNLGNNEYLLTESRGK